MVNSDECINVLSGRMCVCVCLSEGKHHKSVPQFSEIPSRVGNMIVRLIAINSGYTSRVLVRTSAPTR